MKKPILYTLLALALVGGGATADARPGRDRHDRHERHDRHGRYDRDHRHRHVHRTRTIYVIENHRPVRRVVYVDPSGYYYRIVSGRRVRIRDRYFTSYPSRYFYPDGRRRIGISFSF